MNVILPFIYYLCVFKSILSDIGVKRGQDITFRWDANCEVDGTWKKDGLTLHNGGRINITEPKKYLCFNLTICNATEEDEGEYTLELSNRSGDASGSAKVKVLGKFLNSTLLEFECVSLLCILELAVLCMKR